MSRHTTLRHVSIPETVSITSTPGYMTISGPLGCVSLDLAHMDPHAQVAWRVHDMVLSIYAHTPSLTGLWQGRMSSLFHGVTRGHSLSLTLRGIGYRARLDGQDIDLKVGTSHDTMYRVPDGIRVYAPDPTTLIVFGVDANQVHQVGASLIHIRRPSAYQAKGIYKTRGVYRRKAGKRK